METIDDIKLKGSVGALKDEIHAMIHTLSGANWEGIIKKNKFVHLQQSIEKARHKLDHMENCLKAIQDLEIGHL